MKRDPVGTEGLKFIIQKSRISAQRATISVNNTNLFKVYGYGFSFQLTENDRFTIELKSTESWSY